MRKQNVGEDPDFEILEVIDLEEQEKPPAPAAPTALPAHITGAIRIPTGRPTVVMRREAEEQATRRLLRQFLPALDNLESCIRERPDAKTLEQGVRIALRSLWDVFRPYDLERIEGSGMPFDPRLHEAAEITPSNRVPVNTVLETLRVGYRLGGELVRPAMVRVSVEETSPAASENKEQP